MSWVFPTASSPQAMKDPAKNDKVPPFLSSLILGKPDGMPNQLKIKVCSELNYKIHTVTYTLITHSPKKPQPETPDWWCVCIVLCFCSL